MTTANGNGHALANGNGNGNVKHFNLSSIEDAQLLPVLKEVVPAARSRVCQNVIIPESARMFFCWLTDKSLLRGVNSRPGVVKFSDSDLAQRFKVSTKTIRNWKRDLEKIGEVWLTEKWMKNSFPQTVYNITAIVGQATLPMNIDSEDGSLAEDEVFSSNRRRQQSTKRDPGTGRFASRAVERPPGHPETAGPEKNPQISSKNGTVGKILPPTAEIDCRPPRKMVSAHRGNKLPSPTAKYFRPGRKQIAAGDGNHFPRWPENNFRGGGKPLADKGETQEQGKGVLKGGGEPPAPEEQFQTWLKSLEGQFPSRLRKLRETLLAKFRGAQSDEARREWKRRIEAVDEKLLGPKVQDTPKPKASDKAKAEEASFEETKKLFEEAKAKAGIRSLAALAQ